MLYRGLSNQWLVLLKDTALVSLIGVDDLMRQAGYINTNTHEPFTWYGIAALIYLVITLISQAGIRKLELRFTRFERGSRIMFQEYLAVIAQGIPTSLLLTVVSLFIAFFLALGHNLLAFYRQ